MKVELDAGGILINGHEVTLPTTVEVLTTILGEPSRREYERNDWRVFWDDLGVYASGIAIERLMFIFEREDRFGFMPKGLFSGEVRINGALAHEFAEWPAKVVKYQLTRARYMGEDENPVFAYTLGKNYDYKEQVDLSKYEQQRSTGTPLVFKDLNFKLAIIEELMYQQGVLEPKFDITEFSHWYKDRAIDLLKEGDMPIPEALEYFKNLEIDEKFAKEITSINQDGGNAIYMNIAPQWGGDDDTFTIASFEDVVLFPNLKEMTLFYDENGETVLEELRDKGIEADWL